MRIRGSLNVEVRYRIGLRIVIMSPCPFLASVGVFLVQELKLIWMEEEEEDGWVVVLGREEGL